MSGFAEKCINGLRVLIGAPLPALQVLHPKDASGSVKNTAARSPCSCQPTLFRPASHFNVTLKILA